MKQFRRWCLVVLVAFAVLTPVTFSLLHINNVSANTELGTEDLNTIKQNALYKVIYSNLAKCYGSMQGTITESAQNTWASFDSSTYFTDDALADSYLRFPYGVGNQNQSSCPDMITGWNTNWFINLFTGTGSYDGVLSLNADAEVPNGDWYDSSTAKMGNFLKDIGYEETTQDDGDLSDRSCFHLRFKLNQSTYDNWWLLEPSSGEYFETVDYCVKLNGDNTLQQYNDSIIALKGNNDYFSSDYDNGHLTDDSNIAFIFFKRTDNALTPQFRHVDDANVDFSNENYLQANVDYVALRYNAYVPGFGADDLQANTLLVQSVTSKTTAEDYSLCSSLGYVHCGWYDGGIFSSTIYIGSLMNFGGSITYEQFKSRMATLVDTMKDDEGYDLFGSVSAVDYNPVDRSYKKGSSNAKFIRYFLGDTSNYNSGTFTDAEKYMLYYTYLKNNYNVATSDTAVGENSVQVSWLNEEDGTFSRAYIYDPDENLSTTQLVLSGDGKWDGTSRANWHEIAEMLAAIDVETAFSDAELTDSVLDPDLAPEEGSEDAGTTTAPCYESAGALGWIICPVIKGVGGAVSGLYSYISDSFLEVDAELFASGESVYQGWQYFQGFANVIFAIFFIIVILSQVTGIGLSNYGIKKILPRLIAVAILVNLSFIVCQFAVDVSNILGYSLENLLSNIPIAGSSPFSFGDAVGSIVSTLLTGAGLVIGGATLVVTWELWLLPFLLTLLVAIISVIFFFIILGVRKAGVILLVVLAPVAIICYALPNTKKLFDRWLKMFSSLLLVFPICGLLMGGGQFASNLLIKAGGSSEGFFYYLVAMLLTVVPFFFIPALLKGSMAAMGALGAKISGFGSRLGHGASGALKRSERVQDWNKRLRVNTQYRRAQRTMARAEKKGRTLSASQTRRISRAKAAFEKQSLEDAANRHYAGRSADQIDAAIAAQDIKFQQQQVEEEASRIMTGGVDFTDASSHTRAINANDVGDLTMAYDQAIGRSLNMANSAEVRAAATLQAKALQQLLMGKGDTGRSQMLKTLRTHTYSAQGNRAQEDAVKQLYSHLNDNDKWMASIKAADIGSYSLINDAASANPGLSKIKTAAEYNVMGSNKFTAETVGQAGDSFYDNIEQALNDGSFAAGSGNEDKLQSFDRMMTEALTNPRISVKGERVEVMNKVREAAYNARLEDYVQAATTANPTLTRPQAEAEFKAKYGDFRQLYSNDELKIPHPKAQMPTGWRRATIADTMGSHIPSGLKEGDWIQTGAGGTITRLRADEIKRAEAIEQQNIQADINNSLNP